MVMNSKAVDAINPARLEAKRAALRLVFIAEPGFGKTSFAAGFPDVCILMARGETGYQTLLGEGRVPNVDAALVESWRALMSFLDGGFDAKKYKTLVFDALGGFERLNHEDVCVKQFGGDWGEKGFQSYMRGYSIAIPPWVDFLRRLDRLHEAGINIVLLAHTSIKPFKNPIGADFERYVANVHPKTWEPTAQWADTILFGKFLTVLNSSTLDAKGTKGKAIGGTDRVIYTEHTDAWDAKNRSGLPSEFLVPNDHKKIYETIMGVLESGAAATQELEGNTNEL